MSNGGPSRSNDHQRPRHPCGVALAVLGRVVGLACAALLCGPCAPPRARVLAELNGQRIPQAEVMERLRALLWRKGATWDELPTDTRQQYRHEALDAAVDERLLQAAAPAADPAVIQQGEERFQQFLKQFDPADSWSGRAAGQGFNEPQLRTALTEEAQRLQVLETSVAASAKGGLEAEAKAWFDSHGAVLTIPESAHASHLFLMRRDYDAATRQEVDLPDREPEMRKILQEISSQESTFAELAAKYSADERTKNSGGDLGWFSRDRVPADFGDVVFALKPGQVSQPFLTKLGWHIVWLHEKHPARQPKFEEVKEEILALLETQHRQGAVRERLQELRAKARIVVDEGLLAAVAPAP